MTMMNEEMAETIAVILYDLDSSGCSKATQWAAFGYKYSFLSFLSKTHVP